MFKKRAVPASASKTEQADRADADRPLPRSSSDSSVINGLLNAHPNLSMFRNKANRSLPASSTPVGSPTPAGRPRAHTTANRTTPQRASVKGLFLHRNGSMESLTSPRHGGMSGKGAAGAAAADEDADDDASFYTPGSKSGRSPGQEDLSDWQTVPASPSARRPTGISPYLSPYKASRSSPDVSGVGLDDDAVEAALQSFHQMESVPLGTPSSKRGILRDPGRGSATPASGSSVRFFSRDNVHIISPPPSTASHGSSPTASSQQDPDDSEDLSMATGIPAMGSPVGQQEASIEPSFFPLASQIPSTPLQGPSSRSFLAQLQNVSPVTPNESTRTNGTPHRLAAVSTTPLRSPAVRQPSPLAGVASSELNASRTSNLLSLDMLEPPVDMSNLRDTTDRLPDDDQATFHQSTFYAGGGERPTSGESPPPTPVSYDPPTPTSVSFPYADLESSTRSHLRDARREPDDESGDSTQTVLLHAKGEDSGFALPERSRLATQSSFSSVLDFYSRSPPKESPAVPLPSAAPMAPATTPRKTSHPTPEPCGDLTIYHTPRADLQLRILQMELESPMDGSVVLADPDRSSFDPEASFSRSIIDRGLSPGQPGSPSLILSFIEDDSVDYASSSPLTPSLMASFPRAPSPGQPVLVPTSDVAALNAEFYQSHRDLLAVTQKKYDLQVEIATELEMTLRRKEAELRTARLQIDRMGEVRDLEVRLEMQRHDADQARSTAAEEVRLKDEALNREAAAQDRIARLEAEVRDLQIKGEATTASSTPASESVPESLKNQLSERDDEVVELKQQVAGQQGEIKRLAARLIDSALEKDAATAQISALEQDTIASALLHETLKGKFADRERVIERLEARLTASAAESTEQLQDILTSHHRETSEQRSRVAALKTEIDRLQTQLGTGEGPIDRPTSEANTSVSLIVVLATARRDLVRLADQTAKDARTIKMHQEELDHQWKQADETRDELVRLRQHRDQLAESLLQTDETIDGLQADLTAVQEERDALLTEREELVAERDDALAGIGPPEAEDWATERDEIITERDTILAERDAAWEEREELLGQLDDHSQALADKTAEVERLTKTLDSTASRHSLEMEELKRVRAANVDLVATKDRHLAKADALQDEIARLTSTLDGKTALLTSLQARLDEADAAAHRAASTARETLDKACHERERKIRSLQHELDERSRVATALERDRADLSRRFDGLVAEHASRSVELQTSSFRSVAETGELERLTKQIAHLKAEDAAKEVRILHLLRSRDEVRETLEGVEIALDSKQQELELVKRRFGVKGVGGCTPATNRTSLSGAGSTVFPSSASAASRRHSFAPATPSVTNDNAVGSRLSLGGMPETPGPLGRATATRPRSSLAMGTPGLKHVPGSSARSSVGGRPRPSSTAGDLSASTSSITGSLTVPVVPTPSTASRAPSARAAAAAAVAARLSSGTSGAPEPPTPHGRATSRRLAPFSTTAARPLAESNATPRRSSIAPALAGKATETGSQPTPRRSLSASTSSTTPAGAAIKARRISTLSASAGRTTQPTDVVFPSMTGDADGDQLNNAAEDKENVAVAASSRRSELPLPA